jgi:multiple sugar transport system substrate-binding protein
MTMHRFRSLLALVVLAVVAAACGGGEGGGDAPADGPVTLTISENAVRGGKNTATAEYLIDYAIPAFEERMAADGREVTVEFTESGVDDEDYKSRLALDLSVGEGADVIGFDSFWVSEFVEAGYLQPLSEVVGDAAESWEGWEQIPEAVAGALEVEGERYGVPLGTDGRVIFFRRDVFAEAGLPEDWQPTSWDELLEAARTIEAANPDVTPLQINAGVSMGEATTLQGFVPVLLGTGAQLYDEQWLGDSEQLRAALEFIDTVYAEGLGDADLQLRADGRDRSFEQFASGELAMLIESDYLWRSVIEPEEGLFPVENRDEVVGWALIPAQEPGAGIRGQDFVSASGGTGRVINPNTDHPQEAWELLSFLGSEEALSEYVQRQPIVTARSDVNEAFAGDDPMLAFISQEVLPLTWYRPGFSTYPQVSVAIQETVEGVVSDRLDPAAAAEEYQGKLIEIVGEDNVGG